MKRILIFIAVFTFAIVGYSQTKKPRLIVIPSDALMANLGLLVVTDDMGEEAYIQHYKKIFLDTDYKGCVAKINELFTDRGFNLTDLEESLNNSRGKGLVIQADIRLELNYKIEKQGPRSILYFELVGKDVFSSKQVAAASGESKPAIGATTVNLLQEAVLAKIDKFCDDIQKYFEGMFINGRETRLTIISRGPSLDDGIADMVESWLDNNCIKGSYSIDDQDEESMYVSQSMIPLFNENDKPLDAYAFYRPLYNKLKETGYNAKISRKALKSNSRGATLGDCLIEIE